MNKTNNNLNKELRTSTIRSKTGIAKLLDKIAKKSGRP